MFEIATTPDFIRLFIIPVFAYLAWLDIKTRRIPRNVWYPITVVAVLLLIWETYAVFTGDVTQINQQVFLIQLGISIFVLIPLAYALWLVGGFGGADARAFIVIGLLLPTYPEYNLSTVGIESHIAVVPVVETHIGVFSLTILSNAVILGILYPIFLGVHNTIRRTISPAMFLATPVNTDKLLQKYGMILTTRNKRLRDVRSVEELKACFSWRQLDIDALRMYLQWRGISLTELQASPNAYRQPDSLPETPNDPGTGSIVEFPDELKQPPTETDGGESTLTVPKSINHQDTPQHEIPSETDSWGAQEFLDSIEGNAYGTTPTMLRNGLDAIVARDRVWISPGIPFIVPLFFGLVVAFTYGDLLFTVLQYTGVA